MIHVFGAVLVDAIACHDAFTPGTSCIATVRTAMGGVGFNIFRALGSAPRRFITALGDGPFSHYAKEALEAYADQIMVRVMPNRDVSMYLALMQRGRLLYGVTDASTFEEAMDPGWLETVIRAVCPQDIVVIDANLVPDTIAYLVDAVARRGAWIVFEPVSVDKAARSRKALHDVFLITPTEQELEALVGTQEPREKQVFEWMRQRRVEHLVVTMGAEGLQWYDTTHTIRLRPLRTIDVRDTTGAGDQLMGTLLSEVHAARMTLPEGVSSSSARETVGKSMEEKLRRAMDDVEAMLLERLSSLEQCC